MGGRTFVTGWTSSIGEQYSGQERPTDYRDQDLEFATWALNLLDEGDTPIYSCWY